MYLIKRVSTVPATPLVCQLDAAPGDGSAGLQQAGIYYFQPAGQEGDTHQVPTEHAARAIMDDPGLAPHFTCTPALPAATVEPVPAQAADGQVDSTSAARRRSRSAVEG